MKSIFFLTFIVALAVARQYPLYKQCDPQWRDEQLGTSPNTICSAGCLMSSVSMALKGIGFDTNPSKLNAWLTQNGGYISGDLFVWASVNSLGLTFTGKRRLTSGKVGNSQIKSNLDAGRVVVCNVHNGGHWVLAYGYSGDNILVNDPGYQVTSYTLSQIVDGNNGIYTVVGGWQGWLHRLYSDLYYGWWLSLSQ